MKSNIYTLIIFFATIFAIASCENDVWEDLPSPVANFFTTYFPGQEVNSYTTRNNESIATVKGGVTVTFNSHNSWITVNGNGSPLPEILIYDQLPEKLYTYLEQTENTANVYKISRNSTVYTVELLDSSITYDISSQVVKSVV